MIPRFGRGGGGPVRLVRIRRFVSVIMTPNPSGKRCTMREEQVLDLIDHVEPPLGPEEREVLGRFCVLMDDEGWWITGADVDGDLLVVTFSRDDHRLRVPLGDMARHLAVRERGGPTDWAAFLVTEGLER